MANLCAELVTKVSLHGIEVKAVWSALRMFCIFLWTFVNVFILKKINIERYDQTKPMCMVLQPYIDLN